MRRAAIVVAAVAAVALVVAPDLGGPGPTAAFAQAPPGPPIPLPKIHKTLPDDATADRATELVATAINAGKTGDAYKLATQAVQRWPAEPTVRYWAAVAALRTARFDEAAAHVEAGLQATPDDVNLLGLRSQLRLAGGDADGARTDAQRALELSPDDAPDAQDTIDQLELRARGEARAAGQDPFLPPGSAAAFVDGFLAEVAAGASPTRMATFFDLEILDSLPKKERRVQSLVAALHGVVDQYRGASGTGSLRYTGWVVSPDERTRGDRTIVSVQVLAEIRLGADQRELLLAASTDGSLGDIVDPETAAIIKGVAPSERRDLIDRLIGHTTHTVAAYDFEIITADPPRIADITLEHAVSVRAQLATIARLQDKVDVAAGRKKSVSPSRIGSIVGSIVGLVFGLWLLRRRLR